MTTVEFAPLKSAITGSVFGPRDPEYDDARSIWNGQIDHRPAVDRQVPVGVGCGCGTCICQSPFVGGFGQRWRAFLPRHIGV